MVRKNNIKLFGIMLIILSLGIFTVSSQEEDSGFGLGLAMDLGVQNFIDENGDTETYQRVGFVPDISFGNFGISLDLSFHVASDPSNPDLPFKFRTEDWVPDPDNGLTFLELYLPKFNYIRYGNKGDDLYVKMGSIDDATLGTGFIMGNYSKQYVSAQRENIRHEF